MSDACSVGKSTQYLYMNKSKDVILKKKHCIVKSESHLYELLV